MSIARFGIVLALAGALTACATVEPVQVPVAAPAPAVAPQALVPAKPLLKRKVAIGRFTNSTRYGRALLLPDEADPLATQAADMLMSRLVDSGKFLAFERSGLGALEAERELSGGAPGPLVGVDALIIGSVTEFGRKAEGQVGFLSSTKRQVASATVEARLVDVKTGRAFFSTSGTGSAQVEVGEVAGFGSRAAYDSTINDRAMAAAISDLMNNIVGKLDERRWSTDVLKAEGGRLLISGGPSQGLKMGDRFAVETAGETMTSGQTGLPITLPGRRVATVEVVGFFGDDAASQGAVTRLVEGSIPTQTVSTLRVVEVR